MLCSATRARLIPHRYSRFVTSSTRSNHDDLAVKEAV
jgi:hypothetical protein